MKVLIASAAALVGLATAQVAPIPVHNECDFEVVFKHDGPGLSGPISAPISPGALIDLPLSGPGQSIKFATAANPDFGAPISFDFSNPAEEPSRIYYGVSNVAGMPFGVWAIPDPLPCEVAACPWQEGNNWVCSETRSCGVEEAKIELWLCHWPNANNNLRKSARVQQGIKMMK